MCRPFPEASGGYVRASAYRWAGFDIGSGSFLAYNLHLVGGSRGLQQRLKIGANAWVGENVTINLDDDVTIEDEVVLAPFVRIYTGTHDLGPPTRRCDPEVQRAPVVIGGGSWIALGATILPGVTVGRGSVVSCGAIVSRNVPPNSFVTGVPAKVRPIPSPDALS